MVSGREDDSNRHNDTDKVQQFIQWIQLIHQEIQEQLEKSQA